MLAYYLPIHSHALHVYGSAIATMPECALFATVSAKEARGIRLLSPRAGGWTATLRVLEGHAGEVSSVAFSPDGTLLVSGSDDRTVRIWSMRTGHSLAILDGHTDGVSCVAFSPDGNQIASGSHDRTIRLWNTQSFKEIAVFHHNNGAVYSVAYSSTRSLVIYGSDDGTVCVWDPAADSQVFLEGHKTEVCAVACSPHDSRVVSGSKDGMIQVWDSQTGAKLASLEGHNQVTSVSFSLNGAHLVSGLETGAIRVWDARTYKYISALQGHFDSWAVTSVAFSPDSQKVIFGSGDGTVRVWDALLTKQLAVLSGHLACVTSVAFSPDGAWISSASIDGTIRVWDHQASPEAAVTQNDSLDPVEEILCSLDGVYAVSRAGSHARVWDMQNCAEISRLKGHNSPVTAIAFSPDGLRIASGAGDGRVRVWDTRTGRQLAVFNCNDSNVSAVAFSPDGIRVVSCSMTVRVWDIPSREQLAHFTGRTDQPSAVTFSPDGLWIIYGSMDAALIAWDTVTGAQVALNQEYDKSKTCRPATKIVFSADGNWLHTSHDTQELAWDFQDIVTCRRALIPREVTPNAPGNPGPNCTESQIRAAISWDRWTGWLSCTRKSDSRTFLPLCWLPVERRGPAWTVFRRWMVAVGGPGGDVTMLDLTATIEHLQNLGIL
jgi:WD40 repeat protein